MATSLWRSSVIFLHDEGASEVTLKKQLDPGPVRTLSAVHTASGDDERTVAVAVPAAVPWTVTTP